MFSGRRSFKAGPGWSGRRWYIFTVGILFEGGCFLCAAGLWLGGFRGRMALPLGASYLGMIPVPCYFETVDHIAWLHGLRNALFVGVAALCFGIALGVVPMRWVGTAE